MARSAKIKICQKRNDIIDTFLLVVLSLKNHFYAFLGLFSATLSALCESILFFNGNFAA